VGKSAWYVAIDPINNRAYVTRREENKVSVIDTATDEVVASIDVGKGPIGVAVDPDKKRLYVANHEDMSIAIIDTDSNKVIDTIKLTLTPESPYSGAPWGLQLY
jgi:YVTN family beta-propeller protein